MKNNLQNTGGFDEFFKKKYTHDTIEPPEDLWENINQKLKFRKIAVNNQNILRLQVAVVVLAVALVTVFIYFELSIRQTKTQLPQVDNQINVKVNNTGSSPADFLFNEDSNHSEIDSKKS